MSWDIDQEESIISVADKKGKRKPRAQLTLTDAEWSELKELCNFKSLPVASYIRSVVLEAVRNEARAMKTKV